MVPSFTFLEPGTHTWHAPRAYDKCARHTCAHAARARTSSVFSLQRSRTLEPLIPTHVTKTDSPSLSSLSPRSLSTLSPHSLLPFLSHTGSKNDTDRIYRLLLATYHPRNLYAVYIDDADSAFALQTKLAAHPVLAAAVAAAGAAETAEAGGIGEHVTVTGRIRVIEDPEIVTVEGGSRLAALLRLAHTLLRMGEAEGKAEGEREAEGEEQDERGWGEEGEREGQEEKEGRGTRKGEGKGARKRGEKGVGEGKKRGVGEGKRRGGANGWQWLVLLGAEDFPLVTQDETLCLLSSLSLLPSSLYPFPPYPSPPYPSPPYPSPPYPSLHTPPLHTPSFFSFLAPLPSSRCSPCLPPTRPLDSLLRLASPLLYAPCASMLPSLFPVRPLSVPFVSAPHHQSSSGFAPRSLLASPLLHAPCASMLTYFSSPLPTPSNPPPPPLPSLPPFLPPHQSSSGFSPPSPRASPSCPMVTRFEVLLSLETKVGSFPLLASRPLIRYLIDEPHAIPRRMLMFLGDTLSPHLHYMPTAACQAARFNHTVVNSGLHFPPFTVTQGHEMPSVNSSLWQNMTGGGASGGGASGGGASGGGSFFIERMRV
ncbi:unnamed protein product [Closterium sp. Naga37s-1]|nr:unnamed protein product [Closterium sp. Naga37s-1]